LDHFLLSSEAADRLTDAGVDREIRGAENASDHAPAWIILGDKAKRRSPSKKAASQAKTTTKGNKAARSRSAPSKETARPLLVIDGDPFAHRSYPALPKAILRADGNQAGAILACAISVLGFYREEKPGAVLVAWDTLEVQAYPRKALPAYQSGRVFDRPLLE